MADLPTVVASPDLTFLVQTGEVGVGASFTLPAGTVTFLLTDVEGSTRLWEARRDEMGPAIARHYEILDEVIAAHEGVRPVEQGEGDSIVAAFASASAAVRAAAEAQRRLTDELPWLPVRMAVHTGDAQLRDEGNYVGRAIIRCARLRACGHGGQVLVSEATATVVGDELPDGALLADRGVVRLRDLARPERVWQLVHPDLRRDFPPLRSVETTPNNLPSVATSFVGRGHELGEVAALVGAHRLVTLTGSGGCGKTRLALHAAGELVELHPGGVWWAELAQVSVGAQVADRIASSIGGGVSGGRDPISEVVHELRARGATLLVVDNAEHVIDEAARAVDALLSGCPEVRIVVTSREPLGVPGETVYRVPSLPAPPADAAGTLADLTSFAAARLFVDRARQARSNLALDDRSVPAVAAICARLDGIPLALELAAARVRSMPLERLATGLDDAFRLLTGGARTALARQQTLLASIAWSYDLLDEPERMLLRRLAVFHGSFTLDAAESVGADGVVVDRFAVLDLIGRLVDKSLVQFDDESDQYRLLETIRQFATDRLRDAGELYDTRARHADWFATWCEEGRRIFFWDPGLASTDVQAAIDWACDNDPQRGLRLLRSAAMFRHAKSYTPEFRRRLAWVQAADRESDPAAWASAVAGLAPFALGAMEFGYASVAEQAMRSVAAEDSTGQRLLRMFGAAGKALFANAPDAIDDALALFEDAWASNDDQVSWIMGGIASTCHALRGDHDAALVATERVRQLLGAQQLPFDLAHAGTTYGARMEIALQRGQLSDLIVLANGITRTEPMALAVASGLLAMAGQALGEPELIERAHELEERHLPPISEGGTSRLGDVYLRALRGDVVGAIETARFCYEGFTLQRGLGTFLLRPLAGLLLAAQRRDEVEDLVVGAAAAVEAVGRPPLPSVQLDNIRCQALRHDGDHDTVIELATSSLSAAHGRGYILLAIDQLELLAEALVERNARKEATRMLAATSVTRDRIGYRARVVPDPPTVDALVGRLRVEEPDAWAEGERLSLDDAVEYALRGRGERGRPSHGWGSLTPTETRVVELVAEGLSNDDVARRLLMSPATVKTHLTHVYAKTATANRTELTARWRDR